MYEGLNLKGKSPVVGVGMKHEPEHGNTECLKTVPPAKAPAYKGSGCRRGLRERIIDKALEEVQKVLYEYNLIGPIVATIRHLIQSSEMASKWFFYTNIHGKAMRLLD